MRKRKFTWNKWNYDCDGDAYIVAKDECPNREDVPAFIMREDFGQESISEERKTEISEYIKEGWCKYQVRSDWDNEERRCGGYVVEDYEPHTKNTYGKGWFPVWIVRLWDWY